MSITNLGNQYITFDYRHPATGKDFNTLLRAGIKPGIYSGGAITITGANTITIDPFVAYLKVSTDKLVRVETKTVVSLTITESTPILSLTYTWSDTIENWLDWNQRAVGSAVITNEVCLCKMVFVANVISSIDYTVRDYGLYNEDGILRIPIADGTAPLAITSTTKVSNLNVDKIDDCDVETSLTNSSTKIPRSDAVYSAMYRLGSTIRLEKTYTAVSASFPWFCLSYPDQNWTTAHYSAEFIAEMRSRKLIYDEMTSNISSFSGSWLNDVFTLDNNTANNAMLAALAREYLYAGSPTTNWRILHDGTNEFNIIAISVSARTIKVNLDSKTAAGTAIEIYRHRVYGSTTSARHFSEAGLGFYQGGGDKISGLRRLDQGQGHWHSPITTSVGTHIKTYSSSGNSVFTVGLGSDGGLSLYSTNAITDGVNGTPRTGTKTEIEAGTLLAYIYVGAYTA